MMDAAFEVLSERLLIRPDGVWMAHVGVDHA